MSLADQLASFGQLTTIILLLAPLPSFVFCHKKLLEMNASIKSLSFNYLLANFFTYQVWLAYSVKAENPDLIVINGIGSIITTIFLILFLYVKYQLNQYVVPLLSTLITLPVIYACASETLTTLTQTGLIATTLSVATYMTCLDTVQLTLRTRDSETLNMGLTVASFVNGLIWLVYAILVKDIYVFIPNSCAIMISAINLNLYQWTQGKLENSHWLILFLQKRFNVKGNKALRVIQSKISGSANSASTGSEGSTLKRQRTKQAAQQKKFDGSPVTKKNGNKLGMSCSSDETLVHEDQSQQSSVVINRKNLSTKLFEFANEVASSSKSFIISTMNGPQDPEDSQKNHEFVGRSNCNNMDKTPDSADFDIEIDDDKVQVSGFDCSKPDVETMNASDDSRGEHLTYDQYPYLPGVDTLIGANECIVKGSREEKSDLV